MPLPASARPCRCRTRRDAALPVRRPPRSERPARVERPLNPHLSHSANGRALLAGLWRHRQLVGQMAKREVVGRYRGSVMGLAWSFLNPLLMLAVYTFVFSVAFKVRWGGTGEEDRVQFALVLFTGLIVHGLFAEVLNRAPGLILANVNFVKKVVFPLEVLPLVSMAAALFHCLANLLVLLAALGLASGHLHWTTAFVPLILLPLVVLTLGLAWLLASLGVFLRDVGQTIGFVTTVMLFLAPVFYPVAVIPEAFRPWLMANPLTFIIEQLRAAMIWGHPPDWAGLGLYAVVAVAVAWAGFAWFQKTRKGFADVL